MIYSIADGVNFNAFIPRKERKLCQGGDGGLLLLKGGGVLNRQGLQRRVQPPPPPLPHTHIPTFKPKSIHFLKYKFNSNNELALSPNWAKVAF